MNSSVSNAAKFESKQLLIKSTYYMLGRRWECFVNKTLGVMLGGHSNLKHFARN